jgi:hypothetical protein
MRSSSLDDSARPSVSRSAYRWSVDFSFHVASRSPRYQATDPSARKRSPIESAVETISLQAVDSIDRCPCHSPWYLLEQYSDRSRDKEAPRAPECEVAPVT